MSLQRLFFIKSSWGILFSPILWDISLLIHLIHNVNLKRSNFIVQQLNKSSWLAFCYMYDVVLESLTFLQVKSNFVLYEGC